MKCLHIAADSRFRLINVTKLESAEAFVAVSKNMQAAAGFLKVEGLIPTPGLYTVKRKD